MGGTASAETASPTRGWVASIPSRALFVALQLFELAAGKRARAVSLAAVISPIQLSPLNK